MTREEILAMNPGRELDALVAEKVMGQTGFDFDDTHWYCSTCKAWVYPAQVTFHEVHERCQTPVVSDWCDEEGNVMPFYSTDISAAWEVEENMASDDLFWKYVNHIRKILLQRLGTVTEYDMMHAPADVRCKAALLAVIDT